LNHDSKGKYFIYFHLSRNQSLYPATVYLIEAALQNATVTALTLASDCVEEGLSIRPEVRQALEAKLDTGLESIDPDLFKLAAEVKLARRLKSLIRFDEKTDIDNSPIACAEYQLFIDEKRKESKYRQPDHWTNRRFRPGDATKPITGVRASDAEEFCQWLTARSTAQYRLLTLAEAEKYPISLQTIGYWCNLKGSKKVMGISQQCWEKWSHTFFEILDRNCNRDLNLNFIVNLDHALDRDLDLELIVNHARVRNLELIVERNLILNRDLDRDHDLDIDFDLILNRDRNRNRNLIVNRDRNLIVNRDRDRNRNFDLDFARALDFALDRALNIDLDIDRALNRALDRAIGHGSTNKGEALTTLLSLTLAWNLLLGTYLKIEEKKNSIWAKKTTRKNHEELIQKYAQRRDAAYRIYKFCVLVEERQAGKLPAWEGIRIARDRILD
jgi:Sulfatase-modifying factor enzyme 1